MCWAGCLLLAVVSRLNVAKVRDTVRRADQAVQDREGEILALALHLVPTRGGSDRGLFGLNESARNGFQAT